MALLDRARSTRPKGRGVLLAVGVSIAKQWNRRTW